MPDAKICETCRFYRSPDLDGYGGECRRRAPSAYLVVPGDDCDKSAFWPSVCLSDWCGEWRRKEGWE
jgi:hypothetical protein